MKKTLFFLVSILILSTLLGGIVWGADKPVTLKFYHWIGTDAQAAVAEIDAKFMKENPDIKVEFESAPTDQYRNVIKTKLASGDAPDVFGVSPGTDVRDYSKAGYLMDLSNEPYVKNVMDGALRVTRGENRKVYSIPWDMNVITVIYNKKIFTKLGLKVPTNWTEFLAVCEKIKRAKIYPIALGNKDLWVTQLIPYAMAPSMIYAKNPEFDADMYNGKVKFNGAEWKAVIARYLELNKKGYFHPGVLGTTYDQTVQLVATEKAAMVVNGNWILAPIRQANKNLELGMFPMPAVKAGEDPWISSAVGTTTAISAKTPYPEQAKKFMEFWMRPDNITLYLKEKKAFSTVKGITVDFDPAAKELAPYLAKGKTYPFLDQNWPNGVQDVFLKGYQELFAGETTGKVLNDVDKEWADRTKK
jgi:raffinose/stachyose/melibiose transport system substrate-binding protein